MWISRTYDKFHAGFPVKTSLPCLDFLVNFVDFQYHSSSKNMSSTGGYGYFLHQPIKNLVSRKSVSASLLTLVLNKRIQRFKKHPDGS